MQGLLKDSKNCRSRHGYLSARASHENITMSPMTANISRPIPGCSYLNVANADACGSPVDAAAEVHKDECNLGRILVKILASAMRLRAHINNTFPPDTLPPMTPLNLLFGISEASSAVSRMNACCSVYGHETWPLQVGAGCCQDSLAVRTCQGTCFNIRPSFASQVDLRRKFIAARERKAPPALSTKYKRHEWNNWTANAGTTSTPIQSATGAR